MDVRIPGLLLALLLALPSFAEIKLRVVMPTAFADARAPFQVVVTNLDAAPVGGVRFYVWTGDAIVAHPADVCAPAVNNPTSVDCALDLAANESRTLEFAGRYTPEWTFFQAGASLIGAVSMDFDLTPLGRTFTVTNVEDGGAGSLRQALDDVNRECERAPCMIAFAIEGPVPAEGWFTIRPQSPLPPITAPNLAINGGGRVMLDGSALVSEGHGLFFTGGIPHVADLAIGNFPGNGIETAGGYFRRNSLGVDPGGAPAPNGLRGISLIGGSGRIVDNVLRHNRRAGGFFWSSEEVLVYGNVVEDNGASGLFFHKPAISVRSPRAYDNAIARNAHAGIGTSLLATGNFAKNAFRDNAGQPIDVALDGATRETRQGLPGQGGRLGAPLVLNATWDGTATIVEGRIAARPTTVLTAEVVYIYAGPSGSEEVVAVLQPLHGFGSNAFTARIEQDLRGRLVRASHYANFVYDWDTPAPATSELSEPRRVE